MRPQLNALFADNLTNMLRTGANIGTPRLSLASEWNCINTDLFLTYATIFTLLPTHVQKGGTSNKAAYNDAQHHNTVLFPCVTVRILAVLLLLLLIVIIIIIITYSFRIIIIITIISILLRNCRKDKLPNSNKYNHQHNTIYILNIHTN